MPSTDWWALFRRTEHPSFPVPEAGFGSFDSFGTGETPENGLPKAPLVDHSNGHDGAAVVSPEEETDHGLPTTSKGEDVCFGRDAFAAYTPARLNRDLPTSAKTAKTAKTPAASPHDTGFGSFDSCFGTGETHEIGPPKAPLVDQSNDH